MEGNKQVYLTAGIIIALVVISLVFFFGSPPACGPERAGSNYSVSNCETGCAQDSDCVFSCGCGPINKNETCHDEGIVYDCVDHSTKCEAGTCVASEMPLQVTVRLDKNEYEQGQTVNASLSYNKKIYYWGKSSWSIQKLENGNWVKVLREEDFTCSNQPDCEDIDFYLVEKCQPLIFCEQDAWQEVTGQARLSWNQLQQGWAIDFRCQSLQTGEVENRPCNIFTPALPGNYKMVFEYASEINQDDLFDRSIDIKYAEKEFTIKEKAMTEKPKDCSLYELPMTREQIEKCTCPQGIEKFHSLNGAYCASS